MRPLPTDRPTPQPGGKRMNAPKQATPDHPIHELLARRWSPYAFADRPVSRDDLRALFEAARWAASSYNEQPWTGRATGCAAAPNARPENPRERDRAPRQRKPLAEFVFGGTWGAASTLVR